MADSGRSDAILSTDPPFFPLDSNASIGFIFYFLKKIEGSIGGLANCALRTKRRQIKRGRGAKFKFQKSKVAQLAVLLAFYCEMDTND